MTYRGHIENGSVVFDEPATLPEGAVVEVAVLAAPATGGDAKTVDPARFSGVITLTEDPLEYQTRIRGEWS